jgi:5-methyltetrahydropteroyltriglutamate--homocysteine methyltransferase
VGLHPTVALRLEQELLASSHHAAACSGHPGRRGRPNAAPRLPRRATRAGEIILRAPRLAVKKRVEAHLLRRVLTPAAACLSLRAEETGKDEPGETMFETTIAGSLPKPFWLAETDKLWPAWNATGAELERAKRDATLLWLKEQEDAGLDIVTDGEQSRQHFVHGFLESVEGIDLEHKVKMGIRNNRYDAMVPVVVGPLRLKGRVHQTEARIARAHTKRKLKFTMPGPMTIVDTIADRHYGDKVKLAMAFAELLNQEARALEKDGVDVIQFDEPAFNVYMSDVKKWGIRALERAAKGLKCTTCVHICYGYGIKANLDWKETLGGEWRQYEEIFPALAKSRIEQVSLECIHSRVPPKLMQLLKGKDVLVGVIDVASERVETPREVAATIKAALKYVPRNRLYPCTNCGMAPMSRDIAIAKLKALASGAALARKRT